MREGESSVKEENCAKLPRRDLLRRVRAGLPDEGLCITVEVLRIRGGIEVTARIRGGRQGPLVDVAEVDALLQCNLDPFPHDGIVVDRFDQRERLAPVSRVLQLPADLRED